MNAKNDIEVIDSHTGGEPTRVVVSGGPDLGGGSLADRREVFRSQHDDFRRTVVNEPRGSDVLVGALICEPVNPACAAGVIFFNNVDALWMCGHGMIGLVVTLAEMGRIGLGEHIIETPAGEVPVELIDAHTVRLVNVPSYRYRKRVPLEVPELGLIHGDIAWGGNWFFLVDDHGLKVTPSHLDALIRHARQVRLALDQNAITGKDGEQVNHVEFFETVDGISRNFVLCPGGAYDRSPCGTGTSAKLSCLAADGKLSPGDAWQQMSVIGSVFEGSYNWHDQALGMISPAITGSAYLTAKATLLKQAGDPFMQGINLGG